MGGAMVHSGWTSRAASRVARAKHRLMAACLVAAIATTPSAYGQLRDSAAKLIARTMGNPEFRPKSFRGGTWLGNGDFYLDLEPSASGIGSDLVKGALRKLGGDAPASSLMFAKFSPDNGKVGYVRANNIYVEDLARGKSTQLTYDGSDTTINGTSDWVNEEEFDIRDGFAWSPESRAIAFWQFNISGVQKYTLIYDLGAPRGEVVTGIPYPSLGPYPHTLEYPYPLAGTQNSAVRGGVVSAAGGPVVWMQAAGDPHNHYIPEMGWADFGHVLIQHMNRLQNRNEFLLADAATGASRTLFVDEDRAWVEANQDRKSVV